MSSIILFSQFGLFMNFNSQFDPSKTNCEGKSWGKKFKKDQF